jgi:hypothetical protein
VDVAAQRLQHLPHAVEDLPRRVTDQLPGVLDMLTTTTIEVTLTA